jgi:2'-hydroxyisoflavone reductase
MCNLAVAHLPSCRGVRLLIIGGTRFVGRQIAAAAIGRGHAVTLFNRGLSAGPELFPEAELVRGDRHAGGLRALAGRRFDAIVDSSAYFPADVEAAADLSSDRYVFISSGSVYREPVLAGSDESAPVIELGSRVPGTIASAEDYGGLKVLCERAASRWFPVGALILRCGLVVGPGDPTERFVYWPRRVARGGEVLAAEADQPVQFIDARDLGAFTVALVEAGITGVFNSVGPSEPLTMGALLRACADASGSDASPVFAGDAFLLDHGVEPWTDLPLWLPSDLAGFLSVDTSRAQAAGLRTRPVRDTVSAILRWDAARDPADRRDAMPPDRERELLARLPA